MSVHNRIVSKSTELFFNYGINSISTDQITVELGISKRTFYQHFESKQELVKVIVADEIQTAWEDLQNLQMCDYNAVREASHICELNLKYRRIRNINFLRDIQKSYSEVWELYENFKNSYIECMLVPNIRKGIGERYYWPDLNENLTANLWMEVSYLDQGLPDADYAVRQHFIRGLLNARGISEYLFWQ